MADELGPQIKMTAAADGKSMDLIIADKGELRAGIMLTAEQLDQIIAALIELRADLKPEVPTTFPEAKPPEPIKGAGYNFAIDAETGQLIFSVRDKGRGWLSFRFDGKLLERMLGLVRSIRGAAADTRH